MRPLYKSQQKYPKFDVTHFVVLNILTRGRDSSVGIATRYVLDGPWIESRWGARFSAPVQTRPWCPPSLLYNGYRVFPGGKAAGVWSWSPTPSSTEVEGRVELYICSPSGHSWPVIGWTLPLPLPLSVLMNSTCTPSNTIRINNTTVTLTLAKYLCRPQVCYVLWNTTSFID